MFPLKLRGTIPSTLSHKIDPWVQTHAHENKDNLVELDESLHHVQVVVVMDNPGSNPLGEAVQVPGDLGEPVIDHDDGAPVSTVTDAAAQGLWQKG